MYMQDIKTNAVLIYMLVTSNGALSILKIKELTGYDEEFIFMALGWLAKDNRIKFSKNKGLLCVEPNRSNYSEMYF